MLKDMLKKKPDELTTGETIAYVGVISLAYAGTMGLVFGIGSLCTKAVEFVGKKIEESKSKKQNEPMVEEEEDYEFEDFLR